jgi:hypothetical protein
LQEAVWDEQDYVFGGMAQVVEESEGVDDGIHEVQQQESLTGRIRRRQTREGSVSEGDLEQGINVNIGEGGVGELSGEDEARNGQGEEEVCLLSEDDMAELEKCQPGRDGSVLRRRAEQEPYTPTDDCDCEAMKCYLLEEFTSYCKYGRSQTDVQDNLRRQKSTTGMRCEWQRQNMPDSFKSMLTALGKFGVDVDQYTHDYKMCPCGTLYR